MIKREGTWKKERDIKKVSHSGGRSHAWHARDRYISGCRECKMTNWWKQTKVGRGSKCFGSMVRRREGEGKNARSVRNPEQGNERRL